jgi:predicted nucleic-acid-binding Zn-ribbon protein
MEKINKQDVRNATMEVVMYLETTGANKVADDFCMLTRYIAALEAKLAEQATELNAIEEFVADETGEPSNITVDGTEYVRRDIVRMNRKWLLETHRLLSHVCKQNRALEAKLDTAREALKKHGDHKHECTYWRSTVSCCNCGYTEALAALEVEK